MTFTHAYVSMSMCLPCRTELYTGLYPMRSGACWNHSAARPGTVSNGTRDTFPAVSGIVSPTR